MRQQIHAHAHTHTHKNDTQTHGTRNLAYSDNSKRTCDHDASAGRASISKVDAAHDEVTALHVEDVLGLALDDTRRGTCGSLKTVICMRRDELDYAVYTHPQRFATQ